MIELNYFSLHKYVFLVSGAKRAALYNLKSGDIYSIDHESKLFLQDCENNIPIQTSAKKYGLNANELVSFLNHLISNKLGALSKAARNIRKISLDICNLPVLEFIWLEITNGCNLKCIHCYANSSSALIKKDRMSIKSWKNTLNQAADLNCSKTQILGGEPLLLSNDLISLIEHADRNNFEFIEIFTNATLLSDIVLRTLVKYDVNIAVSLFSSDEKIHNSITRSNSHAITIKNIKRLRDAGLKLRISLICMVQNLSTLEETKNYIIETLGIPNLVIDTVRQSGRGQNKLLTSNTLTQDKYIKKADFPKCNARTFALRQKGHNCFSREICVSSNGNIYPCIMERNNTYGNLLIDSLKNILNKPEIRAIRELTKDRIKVCKDCEFRYACFDCRPQSRNVVSSSICEKPLYCLYNPYEGKWKSAKIDNID